MWTLRRSRNRPYSTETNCSASSLICSVGVLPSSRQISSNSSFVRRDTRARINSDLFSSFMTISFVLLNQNIVAQGEKVKGRMADMNGLGSGRTRDAFILDNRFYREYR